MRASARGGEAAKTKFFVPRAIAPAQPAIQRSTRPTDWAIRWPSVRYQNSRELKDGRKWSFVKITVWFSVTTERGWHDCGSR
jgi:hypothetical protein